MPTSTETQILRVGPENSDGLLFGVAPTDRIGFYGQTPIAQRAGGSGSGTAVSATAATTTSPWGFATSTQANQIVTLVNELRAMVVGLGLLVGT